jgi:hypothetical protein
MVQDRSSGGLSTASRWDVGLVLLTLLPLIQLAVNHHYFYTYVEWVDPWLYFGYFVDLPEHLRTFDGTYYNTRLSVLLPGYLIHKWFPPLLGNAVLKLSLFYICLFTLYAILRRAAGHRAALLMAICLGCFAFFVRTIGTDYVDGYGITYFLLASWCLHRVDGSRFGLVWYWFAGVALAAMGVANITYLLLVPFAVAVHWATTPDRRLGRLLAGAGMLTLGFAALLAGLGWYNYSVTGRFWFFVPSFTWTVSFIQDYTINPWHISISDWIGHAYWLIVPAVAVLASSLALVRRIWRGADSDRPHWPYHVQLLGLVLAFGLLEASRKICVLQFKYYASLLMPAAYLALGCSVSKSLAGLSRPLFAGLCATVIGVSLGLPVFSQQVDAIDTTFNGQLLPVLVPLICGVVAVLAWSRVSTRWTGIAVVAFAMMFFCINERLPEQPVDSFSIVSDDYGNKRAVPKPADPLTQNSQQVYQSIDKLAHLVRSAGKQRDTFFWFNDNHSLKPVYHTAASTYNYLYRLLGTKAPETADFNEYMRHRLKAPIRIVLLSPPSSDQTAQVTAALQQMNLSPNIVWRETIEHAPIRFEVTILDTNPAPALTATAAK